MAQRTTPFYLQKRQRPFVEKTDFVLGLTAILTKTAIILVIAPNFKNVQQRPLNFVYKVLDLMKSYRLIRFQSTFLARSRSCIAENYI